MDLENFLENHSDDCDSQTGSTAEIPLPDGWEIKIDGVGKPFFVDHVNKTTTRIDPRDKFTKACTFADCVGDELPYGWEVANDGYFINHKQATTQVEDPRQQWRAMQDQMIKEYLNSATGSLQAKEEILEVKQQRIDLAEEEFQQLHQTLTAYQTHQLRKEQRKNNLGTTASSSLIQLPASTLNVSASKTSLASSSSSLYSRYDPELLRAEIDMAKKRVATLKQEEQRVKKELQYKKQGCETLAQIEHKIALTSGDYAPHETRALLDELHRVQESLKAGDAEKKELMKSLSRLREELDRVQGSRTSGAPSPDISMLALDMVTIASQTDLSLECPPPAGMRVAELAKARLKFDEMRNQLHLLQTKLADLEEKMTPPQLELDRAELDLLWEKEQLLRELKAVSLGDQHKDQKEMVRQKIQELEADLLQALQVGRPEIELRLTMHEQREQMIRNITECASSLVVLEGHLRTLSASTLSTCSSSFSSLASLPEATSPAPYASAANPEELQELKRRLQHMVISRTAPSSEPIGENARNFATPFAENAGRFSSQNTVVSQLLQEQRAAGARIDLSRSLSHSNSVSNESMAGDSGVCDAQQRMVTRPLAGGAGGGELILPPQLAISLCYDFDDSRLLITVEHGRNLRSLERIPSLDHTPVCIQGVLLPALGDECFTFSGPWSRNTDHPEFKFDVNFGISLQQIKSKVLMLFVWTQIGALREVAGGAQIDFAMFNAEMIRSRWVNVLSSKYLAPGTYPASYITHDLEARIHPATLIMENPVLQFPTREALIKSISTDPQHAIFAPSVISKEVTTAAELAHSNLKALEIEEQQRKKQKEKRSYSPAAAYVKNGTLGEEVSRKLNGLSQNGEDFRLATMKEESSDESTVISSQTSTLTRNIDGSEALNSARNPEEGSSQNTDSGSSSEDEPGQRINPITGATSIHIPEPSTSSSLLVPPPPPYKFPVSASPPVNSASSSDCNGNMELTPEGSCASSEQFYTCDKETNTEADFVAPLPSRRLASGGQKSAAVAPREQCSKDAAAKLNRSDSDSSVPHFKKEPTVFQRNAAERRSLRPRRFPMKHRHGEGSSLGSRFANGGLPHGAGWNRSEKYKTKIEHKDDYRTSIDIEVDLLAAKVKLERQQEELKSLREARQSMHSPGATAAVKQRPVLPAAQLAESARLENKSMIENAKDQRAAELIRKSAKHVQKIKKSNNQPQLADFMKKISSLVNPGSPVSILVGDSEQGNPEKSDDLVVDIAL